MLGCGSCMVRQCFVCHGLERRAFLGSMRAQVLTLGSTVHEDVDIKLWAVFGVQLFWEVKELLGESTQPRPLQVLNTFLHGGLGFFQKAHELYTSIIFETPGEGVDGQSNGPAKAAQLGYTVLMCLLPERLDEEIQHMGHTSYPNLNKYYLMTRHPILCGILLHTARLMQQEAGITVETCSRSIMKMAHLYNACANYDLVKATWFDLDHCMTELQGPNLFMLGKPPEKKTEDAFGKAYLFVAGAMSLAYTAPDCRDRKGKRGRNLEEQLKSRKKGQGKVLQKLGPVSLMFEDRFCRAGDRYGLNEEDLQAITERAAAYKDSENRKHRTAANPKTSRSTAKKPKSVAQLLADLSLGLDQEVLQISFPYVCLNIECANVIWKLEMQLLSTHPELRDSDDVPPGFGNIALQLLTGDCDELGIAADEIHRYVGDETPGSTNGWAGAKWMMESIPGAPRSGIEEKMRESMRKRSFELQKHSRVVTTDVDGHIEEILTYEQENSRQERSGVRNNDGREFPEKITAS